MPIHYRLSLGKRGRLADLMREDAPFSLDGLESLHFPPEK